MANNWTGPVTGFVTVKLGALVASAWCSVMVKIWFGATFVSVWTMPDGHSMRSRSTCAASPRPKWARRPHRLAPGRAAVYFPDVSKSEILAELPRLRAEDRQEIIEHLWQIEESSLLQGAAPDAAETALLDRELATFERDGHTGTPWREVLRRIGTGSPR